MKMLSFDYVTMDLNLIETLIINVIFNNQVLSLRFLRLITPSVGWARYINASISTRCQYPMSENTF